MATVHSCRIVIGDVNENVFNVAANALVKVIDCDSFQIADGSKNYRCEVGVGHFTPPELQGVSFDTVVRTPNHDAFGLAVTIFHLLFMGRHPYAGRYSGSDEMPIEKAIKTFRFAYSQRASILGMQPPPGSPTLEIVGPVLGSLFERAFSQDSAHRSQRPSAMDWALALKALENEMQQCGAQSSHKYHRSLRQCPWCRLEGQTGVLFFLGVYRGPAGDTFDLAGVWARISGVSAPAFPSFSPLSYTPSPTPLAAEILKARNIKVGRQVAAAILSLIVFISPGTLWWLWIVALWLVVNKDPLSEERARRAHALKEAEIAWQKVDSSLKDHSGARSFKRLMDDLVAARRRYESLRSEYDKERQALEARKRQVQLENFLDNHLIHHAQIEGIGRQRKAILRSFGIETAADVKREKIAVVKGFGETYTDRLLAWRRSIEQKFQYDPSRPIDPSDLSQLNQKYHGIRVNLQNKLLSGAEELIRVRKKDIEQYKRLMQQAQQAEYQLRQAQADMTVL